MRNLRLLLTGAVLGLTYAAVSKELEKAPEERTWQGTVGVVPYNFRYWEWRGLANEYWNPASDQILSPRAIGVGWGINFAALSQRAQEWLQQSSTKAPTLPER
ncbi:MAG: hypothetical protein H0X24_08330 [Ktedonobacterales bacterium]|nr:hypothetical protein [Ktedonobacterales bacterium]